MWHSTHSDLLLVRVFRVRVFELAHLYMRESRRAPRLAVSLSRVVNTAGTRYSSDIVVNVHTIATFSCRNVCLNELNKLVKTVGDKTELTLTSDALAHLLS